MKIRPVVAEVFHKDEQTDGQRDMTNVRVFLPIFENRPNARLSHIYDTNY